MSKFLDTVTIIFYIVALFLLLMANLPAVKSVVRFLVD
jgi:hypothetical protein